MAMKLFATSRCSPRLMSPRAKWAPRIRARFNGVVYRSIPHSGTDPLDGSYARDNGGRWNPPGSFEVIYTSCSIKAAIAFLREHYRNESINPWEQPEEKQRDLYELLLDQDGLVDAISSEGLIGLGLPKSYPRRVSHSTTQPVGQRLYDEGHPGIWYRCAPDPTEEEIALFRDHAQPIQVNSQSKRFGEWYPPNTK